MEEIKSYLEQEEKSYQDGVTLLSKYCANRNLVNALAKKENAAHWAKLEHELRKAQEYHPEAKFDAVANLTPPAAPETPAPDDSQQTPPAGDTLPPVERKLIAPGTNGDYNHLVQARSHLHNERCKLSNSLADAATDEERSEIISKIESIEASRSSMLEKIKHFEQHGTFPVEAAPKVDAAQKEMDKAEFLKKRNNLRSQLSKAKKAVTTNPNDVNKQEKLAKVEIELNYVELQLKQIADLETQAASAEDNQEQE